MTDTLRGYEKRDSRSAGGRICRHHRGGLRLGFRRGLVEASPIPVILAGGISPENVFDAIGRVKPAGIDSCMQTNARDSRGRPIRFRKDLDRVRRLLDEVRRAEEV